MNVAATKDIVKTTLIQTCAKVRDSFSNGKKY